MNHVRCLVWAGAGAGHSAMPKAVVYLRFDRPRNGFVDPAVVHWDAKKEQRLREMLRDPTEAPDWPSIARNFGVTPTYVLQQAAWMYEKELDLVKRRMNEFTHTVDPEDQRVPGFSSAAAAAAGPFDADVSSISAASVAAAASTLNASLLLSGDNESSDSDEGPSRRLLTASRIETLDADSSDDSFSDSSFLPPGIDEHRVDEHRVDSATSPSSSLAGSVWRSPVEKEKEDEEYTAENGFGASSAFSDGVSRSALEAELLERLGGDL